ncbi:MAG TPA: type VI secretion system tube protein Hcp [Ideonella sp.]|nr:type VI secretion system tube protein Hcp [Ideonella sp.]
MGTLNLFMNLRAEGDRPVKGECEVEGFEGWIEIDDWSWAIDMEHQKGRQSNAIPTLLEFSKAPDRSSTRMMSALISGKPFEVATICLVDATDTKMQLEVNLAEVRVMEYSLSGRDGEHAATLDESWTLDYRAMTFEYRMPSKQGAWLAEVVRPPGAEAKKAEKLSSGEEGDKKPGTLDSEAMQAAFVKMQEEMKRMQAALSKKG